MCIYTYKFSLSWCCIDIILNTNRTRPLVAPEIGDILFPQYQQFSLVLNDPKLWVAITSISYLEYRWWATSYSLSVATVVKSLSAMGPLSRSICSNVQSLQLNGKYLKSQRVAQIVKNLPAVQETMVQSLCQGDSLEKKWLPTPVFLPGEFHGQRSLVGYSLWGRKELDKTERPMLCFQVMVGRGVPRCKTRAKDMSKSYGSQTASPPGPVHFILCKRREAILRASSWKPCEMRQHAGFWGKGSHLTQRVMSNRTLEEAKLQVCAGVLNLGNTHSLESFDTKEYWSCWECDG